ncbi:MAG: hypothetical protein AAF697_01650 [Pseudomonadota bacterium]
MTSNLGADKDSTTDRRAGDRRKQQEGFNGPDRRKGARRTGTDRRSQARHG